VYWEREKYKKTKSMTRTQVAGVVVLVAAELLGWPCRAQAPPPDINVVLMKSTFLLVGEGSQGTGFVLGRPEPGDPTKARYVLVTAAHVLQEMKGETGAIFARRKTGPMKWEGFIYTFRIREGERQLWSKHPTADVAVIYLPLPDGTLDDLASTQLLADDEMLSKFEVHPGDEANCLGYPLGNMSDQSGFPILRSGKIASYPLWPTRDTRVFSLDVRVFPGNSGGPVYLSQSNRIYGGAVHVGKVGMVLGVVTTWTLAQKLVPELFSQRLETYPLDLAQVVHASLVREAIKMLPRPANAAK